MMRNLKSRKAQIATTLTWVPAVIIIFFIMFLFVSATAFTTGEKFLSRDKNSLSFEEEDLDYVSQNLMIKILNTPVGEERMSDLILRWWLLRDGELREQIENVAKDILDNEGLDYVFRINYATNREYGDYLEVRSREVIFPEEIHESNLFVNGEKIKVELFTENA